MSFETVVQAPWPNQVSFFMLILIPFILGIGILKQKKWAWYTQFVTLSIIIYSAVADLVIEISDFNFSIVLQSILTIGIAVVVGVLWKRERVKNWFFQKPNKANAPDRENYRGLS